MTGKEAKIVAIHAGVECGLFNEKLGNLDMISFGPNLYDVHTPQEHMSITSVKNTWDYLLKILEEIKQFGIFDIKGYYYDMKYRFFQREKSGEIKGILILQQIENLIMINKK